MKWLNSHGIQINVVLDVGASNGCWTRRCIKHFPNSQYILYEPQPVHSAKLDAFKKVCKQNVILIKKAVGSIEGTTFFEASDPFGGSLAGSPGKNTIEVGLTTLDASLVHNMMEGPFLIKLDTHGFEKSILEGATKTLENTNVLIIESYNYRITEEAFLFWELCAYLHERGFRPIDMVDVSYRPYDNSLWQMDLFFIKSSFEGFQYISYR